jgi:hypothetical protein
VRADFAFMSGIGEVMKMAVEAVDRTSGVDQSLTGEAAEVETCSSYGTTSDGLPEDGQADAIVQLIRTNGKVRGAMMDLVLSSPYIQWVL